MVLERELYSSPLLYLSLNHTIGLKSMFQLTLRTWIHYKRIILCSFIFIFLFQLLSPLLYFYYSRYLLFVDFPPATKDRYSLFTVSGGGGYVTAVGSAYVIVSSNGPSFVLLYISWSGDGTKNAVFDLESKSTLRLPNSNFAQGRGLDPWACRVRTVFSRIQVQIEGST